MVYSLPFVICACFSSATLSSVVVGKVVLQRNGKVTTNTHYTALYLRVSSAMVCLYCEKYMYVSPFSSFPWHTDSFPLTNNLSKQLAKAVRSVNHDNIALFTDQLLAALSQDSACHTVPGCVCSLYHIPSYLPAFICRERIAEVAQWASAPVEIVSISRTIYSSFYSLQLV